MQHLAYTSAILGNLLLLTKLLIEILNLMILLKENKKNVMNCHSSRKLKRRYFKKR